MSNDLNAKILKIIKVSPELFIFRVAPVEWELAEFSPGQYTTIGLPGSAARDQLSDDEDKKPDPEKIIKRAYSIASSSVEKEYIEFYITMVRSGSLTPRLFNLKEGDPIFMSPKNKGLFSLAQAPEECNLLLMATGTGLAPYISMVRSIFTCSTNRKFAIIHGARHSWDLGYRSELETLANAYHKFAYLPVISRPDEEPEGWDGHTGYIQDVWNSGIVAEKWGLKPAPADTHVFICGNPTMVETMSELMQQDTFTEHSRKNPGSLHVERWW